MTANPQSKNNVVDTASPKSESTNESERDEPEVGFDASNPDNSFHASNSIMLSRGRTAFSLFEPEIKNDMNGNPIDHGTIVLLHGLTDASYIWEDIVEVLMCEDIIEATPRILIFDFYGRGRSPWTGFPCTLDVFVTQTRELLDSLNLSNSPVDIIGYCFGGAVATGFAVKFPSLVKSLCLISSAGVRMKNPARYKVLKKKCVGEFVMLRGRSKMGETQLENYFDSSPVSPHRSLIDKHIAMVNWQLQNTPGYIGSILSTHRYFPLSGMGDLFIVAGRRNRPVLAIWGKDDNFFPLRKAQGTLESAFPDADIVSISDCGHNPIYEKFDEVATSLAEFYKNMAESKPGDKEEQEEEEEEGEEEEKYGGVRFSSGGKRGGGKGASAQSLVEEDDEGGDE